MKGMITDIQRFSLNDGPGIRTTVFLKGCNMHCAWCHNPETIDSKPELLFYPQNCIHCYKCVSVCPSKAHKLIGGEHHLFRDLCIRCGKCTAVCYAQALQIALIDGTAPHVTDPVYPAAVDEIINLGEYWDGEAIRQNRGEIIRINGEIKRQYKHAYQYLAAAKSLMDDILYTFEAATNKAGSLQQAQHIIDRELAQVPVTGKLGKTRRLFASAITPSGIVNHLESLADSAGKVYYIKNLWGVGVHEMLKKVTDEALFRGLDVELYYSPLAPETRIEHVLIPELELAFISTKDGFELKGHYHTILDLAQYTDLTQIAPQKEATEFASGTFHALLDEAVSALAQTKNLHDELEGHYIPHMDFNRVQQKEKEICEQILALAKSLE